MKILKDRLVQQKLLCLIICLVFVKIMTQTVFYEEPPTYPEEFIKSSSVNLNYDSHYYLTTIYSVGDTLAQRIIDARNISPFTSFDQLLEIHGIGEKTLEYIKIFGYIEN